MTGSDADGGRALPLLLRPGLRLAFIGYNPGIESARVGHYYAFRGNVFWRQLNQSGLLTREVSFEDDALLPDEAGIGFTDLCVRSTARADQLTREDLLAGATRLHAELLEYQPAIAVFSGRGIYVTYARNALGLSAKALNARAWGPQAERIGATEPWVIPNSSGLASGLHATRQLLLKELAGHVPAWRKAEGPDS